ncbi:MAG: 2-amino-4-hydroxy-6-hydroxymethyldihydropteridine diphosphokinase [Sphingomonadales bacterium]
MELTGNNRVVIAFGANIGQREANIASAIQLLNERCGKVAKVSPFYESEPQGFTSSHTFLNGCLLLLTNLTPNDLLEALQLIEAELGRIKSNSGYQDRSIDLDIIFYENLFINRPHLQVPHPRYHERQFVLEPLKALELDFYPL